MTRRSRLKRGRLRRDKPLPSKGPYDVSIAILRTVLECYRQLESGEAKTLHEVAKHLGLQKDALYRRINVAEKCFVSLFEREVGRGRAKVSKSLEASEAIRGIRDTVTQYERALARERQPLKVRIGAGLAVGTCALPRVRELQRRLSAETGREVQFEFVRGSPRELMRRKHELELIVVCGLRASEEDELLEEVALERAIICPLSAQAGEKEVHGLRDLAGKSVALLDESYPVPEYPRLPADARVTSVQTLSYLHALVVMSDVATISLPQLLTEDQRRHVRVIPIEATEGRHVTYQLIKPRSKVQRTAQENEVVRRLGEELGKELRRLAQPLLSREELDRIPASKKIVHSTIVGDQSRWMEGRLDWTFSQDYRFTASYRLMSPYDEQQYEYFIEGRVVEPHHDPQQLTWRAWRKGADAGEHDDFVVSCVCEDRQTLSDGVIVGTWMGRAAWHSRGPGTFQLGCGYEVLLNTTATVTPQILHRHVTAFRRKYGLPSLAMPEAASPVFLFGESGKA